MRNQDITPKNDATLGLIYRLNALWAENDTHAKAGDYNSWNNTLDAIYRNLLYRNDVVVTKDDDENIIKIGLSSDDEDEYKFLCKKISKFKGLYLKVKGTNKNGISKKRIVRGWWYRSVGLKDVWLRKLMSELGLYIKETVSDPGGVMGW